MSNPVARALHRCLDTSEIRDCLDAPELAASPVAWTILFPAETDSGFAPFLSSAARTAPDLDPDVATRIAAVWEGDGEGLASLAPTRAAATLSFREEPYGVLLLEGEADLDLDWWQDVVDALGSELVKVQLYETANRESATSGNKLVALNEAGHLVKELDLEVLLTKLMELSIGIMGADVGAIVLTDDEGHRTGIEWGLREDLVLGFRTRDGRAFLDAVLDHGHAVLVEDAAASEWIEPADCEGVLKSILALPLISQSKRLGLIVIVNSSEGTLRAEDSEVLATIANLSAAAVENALLLKAALEHERISAEMQLATDIQNRFLPDAAPRLDGYDLTGWSRPATETGGDYFDFLDLGDGRTGIIVADATGHGMGAALITFIVRASLRALLTRTHDLADVLASMNDLLEEDADSGKFMTFFFGILDRPARRLTYASAGHDPALVHRRETDEFLELGSTGLPLGILRGTDFSVREIDLREGDTLVFGTDGIWEARNGDGEFYGKDRLRELVRTHCDEPIAEVGRRLHDAVLDFHAGAEQRDDITAVLMRVGGGAADR